MGFRFRKSINLGGGVRLNLSKRGVGVSAGVKGARVGIGPRGIRTTTSIPGSGVSYVKESRIGTNKSASKTTNNINESYIQNSISTIPEQQIKKSKWLFGIILGIILLVGNPLVGIPVLIVSVYFTYGYTKKDINKSKINYNTALKFIYKKDYDRAIEKIKLAIDYDVKNIGAHFLLCLILHDKKQDYEKVIFHAKKIIESDAVSQDQIIAAKFIMGNSYFELREFDEAIMILQSIKEELPEEIEYEKHLLIGRSFYEKGQYDLAIEQFKKGPILKRTITSYVLEFKYWLGLTYFKMGDIKRAKAQLSKVYSEDMQYKQVKDYMEEIQNHY